MISPCACTAMADSNDKSNRNLRKFIGLLYSTKTTRLVRPESKRPPSDTTLDS